MKKNAVKQRLDCTVGPRAKPPSRIALSSSNGSPLGMKLESQEQIINMPITNTNVRELQIPASANDKYAKLEIPNYKCLAISIEPSPMGSSMAVVKIDVQVYLSHIFVKYISHIFFSYLLLNIFVTWSKTWLVYLLLYCFFIVLLFG